MIRLRIAWDVVTWWDRTSINIWKTMDHSVFHRLSHKPTHIGVQISDKVAPKLPTWSVVAVVRHDRKVTPPPLPQHVVHDSPMEVIDCVGVYPFPVDLLESEILWDQGVYRKLPPPVLWFWL